MRSNKHRALVRHTRIAPFGPCSLNQQQADPLVALRKYLRFNLTTPVLFSWTNHMGEHKEGGFSTNVSRRGIYVLCKLRSCPSSGTLLMIEAVLPAPNMKIGVINLHGAGRVVRNDVLGPESCGFAAETEFEIMGEEDELNWSV